jgi:hypothetical protein
MRLYTSRAAGCETKLLAGPYAVGVLDLDLGDGYGTDVARDLLDRGVVRRVVFFSGLGGGDIVEEAKELGPVFSKGSFDGVVALVATLGVGEAAEADAG